MVSKKRHVEYLNAVESEFIKRQKKYYDAAKILMENSYIYPDEYPIIKRRILDFDKQFISSINNCKKGVK